MSHTELEVELKKQLSDAALGYQIAWPNQFFPDAAFPYLVVQLLRGDSTRLGANGADPEYHTGIFQVSVMTEKGASTRVANQVCDEVRGVYPAGLRIPLTSGYCDIMRDPVVQAGYTDDAGWRTPISIYYRAKF